MFYEEASFKTEFAEAGLECGFIVLIKPCNIFLRDHDEVTRMFLQPFLLVLLEDRQFPLQGLIFDAHIIPAIT